MAYCGAMWRYSRRRAMPWLVAALALWFAAEWALGLGPASANVFDDPRRDIAMGAFIAEGVLMMNAILGFMDGRIDNESMTPRAREQAGEER
ncbi:MAG: hypothetical protein NVV62_01270 [Terricaulis sp.]|nr:hypothetical protein [Terricaulis sp.]